ncbi:hypothetical protein BGW80DRAFT_1381397 [Lactifluus volemus]|nr:hypothetical protein BGW80DRAFT_1381397 [Lactifluus volemus]
MSWSSRGSNATNSSPNCFTGRRDSLVDPYINQDGWRQHPEFYQNQFAPTVSEVVPTYSSALEVYQNTGPFTIQDPFTPPLYLDHDLDPYINQLAYNISAATPEVYQNTGQSIDQDAFTAFRTAPTSEATLKVHQSTSLGTKAGPFPPLGPPELPPSTSSSRTSAAQPHKDITRSNDTFAAAPYGTTQQGNIQRATRPTRSESIPCPICGKGCSRRQELERHHHEIHEPKNRCPFCPMEWTRAHKIRYHLEHAHPGSFSTEILNKMNALRTEDLVVFLNSFILCRDELVMAASRAPS